MSKTYKKQRDFSIQKAYEKEINIATKIHNPKPTYRRKPKYNKFEES